MFVALFAQVGGGSTRRQPTRADLVGSQREFPRTIPKPAVIADSRGDNVGDCAGRGPTLRIDRRENIGDDPRGTLYQVNSASSAQRARIMLFPLVAAFASSRRSSVMIVEDRRKEDRSRFEPGFYVTRRRRRRVCRRSVWLLQEYC